jgi:hypothetical protein
MSDDQISADTEKNAQRRHSKWDLLVLPALSCLTLGCLVETIHFVKSKYFSEYASIPGCFIFDQVGDVRATPNCSYWEKEPEIPPVEYRFNSCGHRTGGECSAKTPGAYRIVLIGSSFAMGFEVPIQNNLAAMMSGKLFEKTGQNVEVYNEAMNAGRPRTILMHFGEVLDAHPDMILWAFAPRDIETDPEGADRPIHGKLGILGGIKWGIERDHAAKPFWRIVVDIPDILRDAVSGSHIIFPLRHFLYESQSEYVRLSLLEGRSSDFLRTDPGAYWDARIVEVDSEIAQMIAQAHAAGVPFVAVLLPNRVQAAMISAGQWPAGYDPFRLDNNLRTIVTNYGGIYLEILPELHDIPNPEQDYLPVDGHPNALGQAVFADLISDKLTNGNIPALKANMQVQKGPAAHR